MTRKGLEMGDRAGLEQLAGGSRRSVLAAGLLVAAVVTSVGGSAAQSPSASPLTPGSLSPLVLPSLPDLTVPAEGDLPSDASRQTNDRPPELGRIDLDAVIRDAIAASEALREEEWDLEAVAASLGGDEEAAFLFVRDRIGFEPYRGMLRGARGTLAARAGNAYDRATLLKALLDESGFVTRFALAVLDEGMAVELRDRVFSPPIRPLQAAGPLALHPLDAQAIVDRARRDHARVRGALAPHIETIGSDGVPDRVTDVAHHAWVQVQLEGQWVDLDPSLAGATPGPALVSAAQTPEEIPEIDRHAVTVRILAETLEAGGLSERPALEQRIDSAEGSHREILVTFGSAPQSGPGGLLGAVGGEASYLPVITIGETTVPGEAFALGGGDGDGGGGGLGSFGSLGRSDDAPELTRVRLEVTSESPGLEPVTRRRTILDRVPASARAAGSVSVEELQPIAMGERGPVDLQEALHVMISTGAADPHLQATLRGVAAEFAGTDLAADEAAAVSSLGAILWPLMVIDRQIAVASERAIVPGMSDDVGVAFIGRPRVYVASIGPDPVVAEAIRGRIDLLIDDVSLLMRDPTDIRGSVARQIWYGALQAALETEVGLSLAGALEPSTRSIEGPSLRTTEPLTVYTPADVDSLPPGSSPVLRAMTADGLITVVPGEVSGAATWWTIASGDGATRSILDPGLGGWFYGGRPAPTMGGGPVPVWRFHKPVPVYYFPDPRKAAMACAGGNEYQTVDQCVAQRTIDWDIWLAEQYIRIMRAAIAVLSA
ncbi:hypothetical protein BH23CHL8_BH23CHL8_11740 [soil metagenome]